MAEPDFDDDSDYESGYDSDEEDSTSDGELPDLDPDWPFPYFPLGIDEGLGDMISYEWEDEEDLFDMMGGWDVILPIWMDEAG